MQEDYRSKIQNSTEQRDRSDPGGRPSRTRSRNQGRDFSDNPSQRATCQHGGKKVQPAILPGALLELECHDRFWTKERIPPTTDPIAPTRAMYAPNRRTEK